MNVQQGKGIFKFVMASADSMVIVQEIANEKIQKQYVISKSMTKTIRTEKVIFLRVNGDLNITHMQVKSKLTTITKEQLNQTIAVLDGFILINSLCVLDMLSSAFAIKILKQGWTKLERDIYVCTTIVKQLYQFIGILGTYTKQFASKNEFIKQLNTVLSQISTPCILAWGIAEIFFIIECIYFSTFPKIAEVEDNKLLPGIQAKYVFHHAWLTALIFFMQLIDISMDFTDIIQTLQFFNIEYNNPNPFLKIAITIVNFATVVGTPSVADEVEGTPYYITPQPYYIWICFGLGILIQIVTDPARKYVLKLAIQIDEIKQQKDRLNNKVFVAKLMLYGFGQVLNFLNNAYSAYFAIITQTGAKYQPFSIVFLSIFYEFMQIRIISYSKHRIIIFYDYIKNVVKTGNKCCTFFSILFSMSIIFFKYAADLSFSHLKLKYLYIYILNIVGVIYFFIAPVILVALFVVVFICQFSVNILTLFITQFMFPFPFFQNLFGMTDNELKFQQLKYLYSTPLNLLYITVVTLIVYEVPLLTLEITDLSFMMIWLGGIVIVIGQILEYMVYQRQSPTDDCLIDFEQDPDFYCSFLMGFQTMGMTFIPFVGQALNVFSKFMNSPPLARQGEREITMGYFLAVLRFYCFMCLSYLMMKDSNWYIPHGLVVFGCLAFDAFEESKEIVPNSRSISLQDINLTKRKDFYRPKKKDTNVFKADQIIAKEQKPIIVTKKQQLLPKRVPQQKILREQQIKEAEKQQFVKFLENHPQQEIDEKMKRELKDALNIDLQEQIIKHDDKKPNSQKQIERLVREVPLDKYFWEEDQQYDGSLKQMQKRKLKKKKAQILGVREEDIPDVELVEQKPQFEQAQYIPRRQYGNKQAPPMTQEEFDKLPQKIQNQLKQWASFMDFGVERETSEQSLRRKAGLDNWESMMQFNNGQVEEDGNQQQEENNNFQGESQLSLEQQEQLKSWEQFMSIEPGLPVTNLKGSKEGGNGTVNMNNSMQKSHLSHKNDELDVEPAESIISMEKIEKQPEREDIAQFPEEIQEQLRSWEQFMVFEQKKKSAGLQKGENQQTFQRRKEEKK